MKCPVDNTDLLIADRNGIEIDYCPKCRGVWLDRGELDKLIERSASIDTRGSAAPPRRDSRTDVVPDMDDTFEYNRRGDARYDDDRDDRYDDDNRNPQGKKKKSFLGDMFDLF